MSSELMTYTRNNGPSYRPNSGRNNGYSNYNISRNTSLSHIPSKVDSGLKRTSSKRTSTESSYPPATFYANRQLPQLPNSRSNLTTSKESKPPLPIKALNNHNSYQRSYETTNSVYGNGADYSTKSNLTPRRPSITTTDTININNLRINSGSSKLSSSKKFGSATNIDSNVDTINKKYPENNTDRKYRKSGSGSIILNDDDGGTSNYQQMSSSSLSNNNRERRRQSLSSSSYSSNVRGLRNLGNTCFMNSIIQCLSNTKLLRDYCFTENYKTEINTKSSMKGELIKSFSNLISMLWSPNTNYSPVSPSDFKSQISKYAPRFVGYNQQDSQEFLLYLLEGLHADINKVNVKQKPYIDNTDHVENISADEKSKKMWNLYIQCESSKIVDIFVGQLQSSLRCMKCNYVSNTFEPMWMLHLALNKRNTTLENCLEQFTREEILDGDEKPRCAQCKGRQRSTKKYSIKRFPKVLIIQLKRFEHGAYRTSKLTTDVRYPLTSLDLAAYSTDSIKSPVYDLYAVSNHSGTPQFGHYTADALHPDAKKWNHFNDTSAQSVSSSTVVSQNGYILFYSQRNI